MGMETVEQQQPLPSMIHYVNADGSITHDIGQKQQPHHLQIKSEYDDDGSSMEMHGDVHIKSEYYDDMYQRMRSDDIYAAPAIPAITALRRMTSQGGLYADTVPPFSPDIPEKKIFAPYQLTQLDGRSMTPQTAEIPSHMSPNAPSPEQYYEHSMHGATMVQTFREQGSPDVTSTDTSIGHDMSQPMPLTASAAAITTTKATKATKKGQTKRKSSAASIRSSVITTSTITDSPPTPGDDPLRCTPCDKVFNKACYLTQHNKTFHSGEKPYKCQRCGKRFPCDQSHDEHLAKHMGNKPFKCNQCTKQFNHKTDLRRHMCLHTGTKPYSCSTCNKGFIRKDHMQKHYLTHLKRKHSDVDSTDGSPNSQGKDAKRAKVANNKRRKIEVEA